MSAAFDAPKTGKSTALMIAGSSFIGIAALLIISTLFMDRGGNLTNVAFDGLIIVALIAAAVCFLLPHVQTIQAHLPGGDVAITVPEVQRLQSDVKELQFIVQDLEFLTKHFLSRYELEHLKRLV